MTEHSTIDRRTLEAVRTREAQAFAARTPASAALRARASRHLPNGVPMSWMAGLYRFPPPYITHGKGATFFDVDGNAYLDFNVCDLSMTMGFGSQPIVEAASRAVNTGAHFLLPGEDSIHVAEELASRMGLPFWQFTLSASGANVEVMRIARVVTGRRKLLVFEGHYHGHFDEGLVARDADGNTVADLKGLPAAAAADTVVLPFNDLGALEERLSRGDVALVLTEPALTNCTLVKPNAGFLAGLRALTTRYGTLLCYDEAHTFQFAYGGLVREWNLEGDFVVLGKGLGTGISFALYGMSAEIARTFIRYGDVDIGPKGIATGGTTYATTIAVAAARAALTQVLTRDAYTRLQGLGRQLADGLAQVFANRCIRKIHGITRPIGGGDQLCISIRGALTKRQNAIANKATSHLSIPASGRGFRGSFIAHVPTIAHVRTPRPSTRLWVQSAHPGSSRNPHVRPLRIPR